jgi:hypothetical protein
MNERFLVFNATDGIYASPKNFTKAAGEKFIRQFRQRYAGIGYYATADGRRIAPQDILLELKPYDPENS